MILNSKAEFFFKYLCNVTTSCDTEQARHPEPAAGPHGDIDANDGDQQPLLPDDLCIQQLLRSRLSHKSNILPLLFILQ